MTDRKPKVIIVDDDRELRDMLALALKHEGFEVSQAANGLKLISTLHVDRPDLILMDVNMSWIDGFELCRALKRNPEFCDIPILFISGRGDAADVREGMQCGAAGYFTKPIEIEKLLRQVTELLPSPAQKPA